VILSSGQSLRVPLEGARAGVTANGDSRAHRSLAEAERAHIVTILQETGASCRDLTERRYAWE
jgi:hypothetical protein